MGSNKVFFNLNLNFEFEFEYFSAENEALVMYGPANTPYLQRL